MSKRKERRAINVSLDIGSVWLDDDSRIARDELPPRVLEIVAHSAETQPSTVGRVPKQVQLRNVETGRTSWASADRFGRPGGYMPKR